MDELKEKLCSMRARIQKLEKAAFAAPGQSAAVDLYEKVRNFSDFLEAVKLLLLEQFTPQQLAECSVSGKQANSTTPAKPSLPRDQYTEIVTVLKRRFPGLETSKITNKVHSVQKQYRKQ